MLAPFVIIGILFVIGALLWTRRQGEVSEKEVGSEDLERGGGR